VAAAEAAHELLRERAVELWGGPIRRRPAEAPAQRSIPDPLGLDWIAERLHARPRSLGAVDPILALPAAPA
jgi:hypothetical protein